jgi:hypothetical protein
MLPMNKIMNDIAIFMEQRDKDEAENHPFDTAKHAQERSDKVVLFANKMSDKYEELVSVELVTTLMTSYKDLTSDKKGLFSESFKDSSDE